MKETIHIACPHCRGLNRVPTRRLTHRPNCGLCHAPLFTGHPITLTPEDFDLHVSRSDVPLVVDFWDPWCGPCLAMAPAFEQAVKTLEPQIRPAKVNTEEERGTAPAGRCRNIPVIGLIRKMQERTITSMSIHRVSRAVILSLSFMATAVVGHGNVSLASDGGLQHGDRHRLAGTVSESSVGDAPRGKELYGASCVVCHGPKAEGNIGPRLAGNPLLSNEEAFRKIVHEGRHMMPPLKGSITDGQLADILAWLRTLP